MKTNPVKRALRQGKPVFGTWLSSGDLQSARLMARSGFDWLTVDMEHHAIDWSTAAMIFAAVAEAGCVPLARVPAGHHDHIKRVLDAGAWGIVVPMIDTVEQAQTAIQAAKYPPHGNRSFGGGMHVLNFDTTPKEYYARANDEILVILQTESPTGVDNAEKIYALEGVDAILVGPNDLRGNMVRPDGRPVSDEEFETLVDRVIAAGKKTGTPTGLHVQTADAALRRVSQGMQFLPIASDLKLMVKAVQEVVQALKPR